MNVDNNEDSKTVYPSGARIAKISYRTVDMPLKQPFRFATSTLRNLPYAWVRIVTSDGVVGFGEAPTYWDPTGETQLAAIGAFKLWEDVLIGRSVFAVREICALLEKVSRGAYAARCGIEMAVLDAHAKTLNVPAFVCLGGAQSRVKVNAVIGLLSDNASGADKRFAEVIAKIGSGIRTIKIKSSDASFEQDLALVRKVRERFGNKLVLFVDANQSWGNAYQAAQRIDRLAAVGANWIEQPIMAHDLYGQQYLCTSARLPTMLDEGLQDYISLAGCVATRTVQYANLKLAKAGGPFSAMKFIDVAEANAISYSIGSMIESGLGMLANYHVARASRPLTCDLDAYWLVGDGLEVGFIRDGEYLTRKDETVPGLGYDLVQMEQAFNRGRIV